MVNTINMRQQVGSYLQPAAGLTIAVYEYHASDVAGGAPNGSLIGSATEVGNGQYTITLTRSKQVTVANGGLAVAGMIGVLMHGDKALTDSVDTTAADFVEDF